MVSITESATTHLQAKAHSKDGMVWMIHLSWDKGDAEVRRSPEGQVIWDRSEPRGWIVELGGYFEREKIRDWGQPLATGIYLEVVSLNGPPFPGGLIDVENGKLVFNANAA